MSGHWSDAPPDRIVTMPPCPSTNALWVRAPGKPRVRSPEYRAWAEHAGWDVRRQLVGVPPIDCRFNVLIEVPISRRDTSNWEKATLDLCETVGLVANDGNSNEVLIRPVAREDVMVALWVLPEMGAVRAPAAACVRATRTRRHAPKRRALTWLAPGKLPA
jgi:Holliday junction resolvase RusA-like endonuclease